jgi:DNA-binding transcriptional ArsR family regulator
VFHALGDPTRRTIVERLSAGPASVSMLAVFLGITVTAIGQHLHVLEQSGLASTQKNGRVRVCQLNTAGFHVLDTWIAHHRSMWESRLDRMAKVLDEDDNQ